MQARQDAGMPHAPLICLSASGRCAQAGMAPIMQPRMHRQRQCKLHHSERPTKRERHLERQARASGIRAAGAGSNAVVARRAAVDGCARPPGARVLREERLHVIAGIAERPAHAPQGRARKVSPASMSCTVIGHSWRNVALVYIPASHKPPLTGVTSTLA